MTIEQLIIKLRQATNEQWVSLELKGVVNSSIAYDLILHGKWQHTVTKVFIDPIPVTSFKAKQLIDFILESNQQINDLTNPKQ